MLYGFDVSINERDYFEFNKFHILKSPYGKKNKIAVNAAIGAFALAAILLLILTLGFSVEAIIAAIPIILVSLMLMISYPYIVVGVLKLYAVTSKKRPKNAYASRSRIEFFDDFFSEETDIGRTETKYFALDCVSATDTAIYLHLDASTACILPLTLFNSREELDGFVDFLKTKNNRVTVYRRKNNVKGNS
jgi:hypothetical protein